MQSVQQKVKKAFESQFEGTPTYVFSPGRVNLIGEHTDYNKGFVLPAAIDKGIVFALKRTDNSSIRLLSSDLNPNFCEVTRSDSYTKTGVDWADYIIGVVDQIQKAGHSIGGFDCAFGGDVPIGAGLSSSAALEGGIVFGLSELFDLGLSRLEMTKFSMQAENQFVGVQCGIMDQFASLHGNVGRVMKLDCRSLDFDYYPFEWEEIRVLLCDTKVRRTLAGSEYNVRRTQCETGVAVIQQNYPNVKSLRDVTITMLQEHQSQLDEVVYRRCLYVIEENERVEQSCQALLNNELERFGELMYASHEGLRDRYEVSCSELDVLVEATRNVDGVLGSRMMGGGFGGCTINLVHLDKLDESMNEIRAYYHEKTGNEPEFHVVKIGQGTHLISAS